MVTRQLQAERSTWLVRRPKPGVLPSVLRNQPNAGCRRRTADRFRHRGARSDIVRRGHSEDGGGESGTVAARTAWS